MKKKYQLLGLVAIAAVISACGTQGKIPSREAVDDYVTVAELEEVKFARYIRQLNHTYVNDYYVILSERDKLYLAEFVRRCYELTENIRITPDIRREPNVIRARLDTIRGCHIKALYELNEGQAAELRSLGDAPGDTLK
ncbi:MAG: hypothetical protein KJO13_06700 [Gammaproteobacteria bacterium]|nr:hypothetical protein [Gammaproteobacteria bacterium]